MLVSIGICAASCAAWAGERLDPRAITVTDGDTIKTATEKFRILEIDTPEVQKGMYGCIAEKMLGDRATAFVENAIANARTVEVERDGQDRFGRTLAHVYVDGANLADLLLREGLAGRYLGHQVDWCAPAQ